MPELTVENLHLKYGDNPILKGVALTLDRGEVGRGGLVRHRVAVHVGPSGRMPSRIQRDVVFTSRTLQLDVVFEQGI